MIEAALRPHLRLFLWGRTTEGVDVANANSAIEETDKKLLKTGYHKLLKADLCELVVTDQSLASASLASP